MWDEIRRPATAIAIGLAVVSIIAGIVTSLYFYQKSEKTGKISFQIEQIQIYEKNRAGIIPLTVHDEAGNIIDDNIFAANITIWNSGNAEIQKENVRHPFHLIVKGDTTKIIDTVATFFSKDNIDDFLVNKNDGKITWQHFDVGEGLKIRTIYANSTMQDVVLNGYAVGIPVVDEKTYKQQSVKPERIATVTKYLMIFMLMVGLLGIGLLVFLRNTGWSFEKLMQLLYAIIMIGMAASIYFNTTVVAPPF
jgi:hypothetical protein